jgi:hypothetical protein
MVPLALAVFLDLIREKQAGLGSEQHIPSSTQLLANDVEIETQKGSISQTTGRLISVLITDEEWVPKDDVAASNRTAVYDGILMFDPEWIIIVENKPSWHDVWGEELHPHLPDMHDITIDKKAVVLLWRNVIDRLTALVSFDVLSGAELLIVNDFLQFIDENFPSLNPYNTFGKCKNMESLLQRRCGNILEAAALGEVALHPGSGDYYFSLSESAAVKRCYLYPKPNENEEIAHIELAIHPGDTMSQARALYAYLFTHGSDDLFALRGGGWSVMPNFHFGFMHKGFGHGVHTGLPLEKYVHYWMDEQHPIKAVVLKEQTFESALHCLVDAHMMDEGDVGKVLSACPSTSGNVNINVIPGITMTFDWSLNKAIELDSRGEMVNVFKQKANEALAACGCQLL